MTEILSFWYGGVARIHSQKTRAAAWARSARCRELGLDALELGWVQSVRVTEADLRRHPPGWPGPGRGAQRARPVLHQPERHG